MIPQMEPWFDDKEAEAVHEYMRSGGWVTEFRKTEEFAQMIAKYTGAKHCSIIANGTLSLTCALVAVGVGPSDEVIVPDYTMVATPNSVEILGAKAVFVDVEPETACMDFEAMKKAITPKTKAVMLVTINGRYPSHIQRFRDFCDEKNLFLIEDAAQSLGSFYEGKHLGRFGHIGSFSFSAPKIITTGQGGALITDDDELFEKIKKIRDFGREKGGSDHYLVKGWNFKFTDLQAVVGIEQMKKVPWRVERKKAIGKLYESLLEGISGVTLMPVNYENTSPWFFDIFVECREELKEYLKSKGVGVREFYPPLHSSPAYGLPLHFPVTEKIARTGLWLPSSSKLTDEEVRTVCTHIREFFEAK